MKIAIAQLNYTIGDIDGNTSKIIDAIQRAKAQRADLVIFAEQAVSGTPAFDLLRKTTFLELCEDALVEIASCCDGIAAIVGLPILTSAGTISAAALIQDRKVLRYVGKKYITARREMGFLVPSKGYEYATIKGHKCAIIVGDDLSREHDFDKSVETIISINARRYGKGTMIYRYEMLRNLAFVEGKNLVIVNQVGGSTEIVYDGTSGALNKQGEPVLMLKNFEEDFGIFDTRAKAAPVEVPTSSSYRTRLIYEAPAAVCATSSARTAIRRPRSASRAVSTRPSSRPSPSMRWARRTSMHCSCRRPSRPTSRSRMPNCWPATSASATTLFPFRKSIPAWSIRSSR